MKKSIEVEYVGVEDVVYIIYRAVEVTKKGMFASVQISNYDLDAQALVSVYAYPGDVSEMSVEESHEHMFNFRIGSDRKGDVAEMNKAKDMLNNMLA